MKKVILALAVLALALAFVPSSAAPAPNPIPNSCLIAGGEATDGTGFVHCEFTAAATGGLHGYVGLVPNDFVIWLDANNNNNVDAGETVLAEVVPTEPPAELAGQLDVADGAKVDVRLNEGCAMEPGCGWIGALLVG